jgi:hypothetical protein
MADSDINLETHFPDGSPRPQRLTEDTTYEEFLEWFEGSSLQASMEGYYSYRPTEMNALSVNSPGYERNEAGRYVNENGEELFYYTGPDYDTEYKNGAGLNADAGYMTMADIEAKYNADDVLQRTFGSIDQYRSYISDRQNLIDQGVIMDKWESSNQLWHDTYMRRLDGRGGPNGQYIANILEAERRRVEEAELAAIAGLAEQYGIETNITDTNGNQLRWNGSGYSLIERYKEDDNWGRTIAGAGAGLIVGGALAPYLGSLAGAAPAAGAAGPSAPLLSSAVVNGIAAGAGSAASQGLLTGSIDPLSVLSSAVVGGVNPGGMLGDKLGLVPENVTAGFVQGASNSAVGNLITDGSVDLQGALLGGALGAGKNALMDFFNDSDQFSVESEMRRIELERKLQGLEPLSTQDLYAEAMFGNMTGRSDLGGLIGEDGLLSFIPTVKTGGLNNLLGGGYLDPNSIFTGPDGKQYTDIELLQEGIDPAAVYAGQVEGYSHSLTSSAGQPVNFQQGGFLGALAEQEFKDKYGVTPTEFLDNGGTVDKLREMVAYGPLDETYNWSNNPRGDSQWAGLLTGVDGSYSTGSMNDDRQYQDNPNYVIRDALNLTSAQDTAANAPASSGGSQAIINLGAGEVTVPANAVLPGSNMTVIDAISQGIIDGILVGSDSADSGNNTATNNTANNDNTATNNTANNDNTATNNTDTAVNSGDTLADSSGNGDTTNNGDNAINTGDTLAGSENTVSTTGDVLPSGGSSSSGGGTGSSPSQSNGLPPLWGELFGYTKISPWEKARLSILNDAVAGLTGDGLLGSYTQKQPYMRPNRDLIDAGILS